LLLRLAFFLKQFLPDKVLYLNTKGSSIAA
jgi:hypothetical protein